jgi:hypothetical protein
VPDEILWLRRAKCELWKFVGFSNAFKFDLEYKWSIVGKLRLQMSQDSKRYDIQTKSVSWSDMGGIDVESI